MKRSVALALALLCCSTCHADCQREILCELKSAVGVLHKAQAETQTSLRSDDELIADLEARSMDLEAALADDSLADDERFITVMQLIETEARRIALHFTTAEPTPEELDAIRAQISSIDVAKLGLEEMIAAGVLSEAERQEFEAQIANLDVAKAALEAVVARNELMHFSDAGAAAAEQYRKSARRFAYVSSLDPEQDVIYQLESGNCWTVGENMSSGVYRLLYLGSGWAEVDVSCGEYQLANYKWSADEGTEYDEYVFPLAVDCVLSCTTSQQGATDFLWLVKVAG